MTISTEIPRISYALTESILANTGDYCNFSIPFAFEKKEDIGIILDTGVIVTDYSPIFDTSSLTTGSVNVLKSEINSASIIYIYRNMAYVRETEFQADSDFRATVINGEFDRMIWLLQQMSMQVRNAIHKPLYEDGPDLVLPSITKRKNKVMAFDNNGLPTMLNESDSLSQSAAHALSASTYAATAAASAAAADTALSLAEAAVEKIGWSDVVFVSKAASPYRISEASAGKLYSFDCSAGDIIVNLDPISALSLAEVWAVGLIKRDASGYQIIIQSSGSDTINGDNNITIGTRNAGVTLVPDADTAPAIWTPMYFGTVTSNMSVDNFTANVDFIPGFSDNITLSIAPGNKSNLAVTFDGIAQHRTSLDLFGRTLTFSAPIPTGVNEIEVWIGSTISIGVPADSTVTSEKLAGPIYLIPVNENSGLFDMAISNDFICTPANTIEISFLNKKIGQRGMIILDNPAGHAIAFGDTCKTDEDAAYSLSVPGFYQLAYNCYDGVNLAITYSGRLI